MTHLLEIDLERADQRVPIVEGPARLYVRAGDEYLGDLTVTGIDPARARALRSELTQMFAFRLYARSQFRPMNRAALIRPEDVSLVICTRERPDVLDACLREIVCQDSPPGDVLVVDNAPTTDRTRATAERYGVRYAVEPQPGIGRARERGWRSASTAIVAYVDDDAKVDRGYVSAIAAAFLAPEIAAVCGLVLPAEFHTYPQETFETHRSFGRGYERRIFHRDVAPVGLETFRVGATNNMAIRREVLEALGGFDPRLGGPRTRTGEDIDLIYRLLEAGHVVLYEPRAVVKHIHRASRTALLKQMVDWGTAVSAYFARRAEDSPAMARKVRRFRIGWHLRHHVYVPLLAIRWRQLLWLEMALADAYGSLRGARALAHEVPVRFDVPDREPLGAVGRPT